MNKSTAARQKSSKSKRKGEKMKEKALGTSERLGTKVQQRENRKVSLRGCCRRIPCATSVTDLYACLPLPVSTGTSQTSMGLNSLTTPFLSLASLAFSHQAVSPLSCRRLTDVCSFSFAGLSYLVRISHDVSACAGNHQRLRTTSCRSSIDHLHNTKSRLP